MSSTKHHDRHDRFPVRGPIAVTLVLLAIFVPLLQLVSWTTLLIGTLLAAACSLALYDSILWTISRSKGTLNTVLHQIVLDDVLGAIFHPETGILSVCVATFLGNAVMYTLPTTAEQRVQLVQHALDWTEGGNRQAQGVLREPGGFLRLFPDSVQNWLKDNDDDRASVRNHADAQKKASPVTASSKNGHVEEDGCRRTTSEVSLSPSHGDDKPCEPITKATTEKKVGAPPPPPPGGTTASSHQGPLSAAPSPMDILVSILQDLGQSHWENVLQGVQQFLQSVPNGSLEVTSFASAVLLCAQLRYSRTARKALWTSLQASLSIIGSATFVTSTLVLLAKCQLAPKTTIPSRLPFQVIAKELWCRLCHKVGDPAARRKWQGVLAALVLVLCGRRPRR